MQVDEVEVLHAEALEGAVDGGLRVAVLGGSDLGGAVGGELTFSLLMFFGL